MNDVRRYIAELLGTALLVVAGVGTAVLAPKSGPIAIALAFGLILLALAYVLGPARPASASTRTARPTTTRS